MKFLPLVFAVAWLGLWTGLWYRPDQLGQHYYQRGDYGKAADSFNDPLWKGVAEFKSGDFEKASQTFARVDTPQGHYNRGNAFVMRGKYDDAAASYRRALEMRPDWKAAQDNLALAKARAKLLEQTGGNATEGELGADKTVFDENKKFGDEATELTAGGKLSDNDIQALWLRRVQTRPADFLKAKFAYQLGQQTEEGAP